MIRWALALAAMLVMGCASGPETPPAPSAAPPHATPVAGSQRTASAVSTTPPMERSLRTVVVDAGHGGEDLGARGVSGSFEKDVTLATATKVARSLRQRGFTVIETRTNDTTVELKRRTELANASGAGLFVSIHANSAPSPGAHGIETYSMDLASDESALRLAERENRATEILS
ncbi:MAG: N-acetylmuramoyl-L-alanine amidase, partial [Deltaproteobacteria bacterium]|nr:N-acetylmuramoyl-L-alanine amidase [Deltaproteobacteria bacterium]